METNAKDVPSREVVSVSAFLKGTVFMTLLTFVSVVAVWKSHAGADFRHIVGYGISIVTLARIMTWLTTNGPDPVCTAITGNIMWVCVVVSNLDVVSNRTPPPFQDVIVAVLMVHLALMSLRGISLAMNRTVPILIAQQLVLGAGLYGLHQLL
ncbi:MAG: hypothetical protein NTX72_04340 [Candidatus Uhrbacteria bacterium]|nr:hypothetical protein [Candidatus Uhrbacteria bacterium]